MREREKERREEREREREREEKERERRKRDSSPLFGVLSHPLSFLASFTTCSTSRNNPLLFCPRSLTLPLIYSSFPSSSYPPPPTPLSLYFYLPFPSSSHYSHPSSNPLSLSLIHSSHSSSFTPTWLVQHVMHPAAALLHANAPPLLLRHETILGSQLGDGLGQDHVPADDEERKRECVRWLRKR